MPQNFVRVDTKYSRYRFDSLKHGDKIEVSSRLGAREMFRRWKKARGRQARLIASLDYPNVFTFIDESLV